MKRTIKSIRNIFMALVMLAGGLTWFAPAQPVRAAGVWYVAPGGDDATDCTSPSTPCLTIQAASDKIYQANYFLGAIIRVATGVYTNTSGSYYVVGSPMYSDLNLSGGWNTSFSEQNGYSTIDGQNTKSGIYFYSGSTHSLDHFIVQNGKSNDISPTGGIVNMGNLTITNSIITHNVGEYGGGINSSRLILKNSVISHNYASVKGGGIFFSGSDSNYFSNSTIYDNSSPLGGGIYFLSALGFPAYLNNLTIASNTATTSGGGIYSDKTSIFDEPNIHLTNTILAGNGGQTTSPDCSGSIISDGYNLIKDVTGCTVNSDATGDQTGVDPALLPVVEVGGYFPLAASSVAVNAGNPAGCADGQGNSLTTDQRGAARSGLCDIGAYEYTIPGPAANLAVVAGKDQTTGLLEVFPDPLQVQALDSIGSPVSDESITFTAPVAGPSGTFEDNDLTTISVTTDEGGLTPGLMFRASSLIGSYLVSASNQSQSLAVDFNLTNIAKIYLPLISKPDPALVVDEFPFTDHCVNYMITYSGQDEARITECIFRVRIRLDGQMYFDMRWSVEFLDPNLSNVYKYSDAGNLNMYITDNLGNRYDHVDTGGAAAYTTYFYPSGPLSADGWFLFPAKKPGTTIFAFHIDDEGSVITNLALIH